MEIQQQIVTVSEFAKLMRICPTTAHTWLAAGRLDPFVIRGERVIRIIWSQQLLDHLILYSSSGESTEKPILKKRTGTGSRSRLAFDADAIFS